MDEKKSLPVIPLCTCTQDLFADLPVELRPKPVSNMNGLREVTCPGCTVVYWTNRITDVRIDCEKKGVHAPQIQKEE